MCSLAYLGVKGVDNRISIKIIFYKFLMDLNIYSYFSFYFIIIFSVVGYGLFFSHITNVLSISKNFGYAGLLGLFFLTIYSYLSNFFFAHSLTHNSLLIFLGIVFYLYFIGKNTYKKKKFLFFVSIFLVFFISVLIFKTHDDFPYYHFAYSYYLTQSSSYIGIGPFNHGFKTPSSIFYLNSLFYLPIVKYYMFHMPALLIMGFSNIILFNKIIKNIKNKSINFLTFFSLFSILFINIFFYRVGEHGTDRSAQILVFILLIEILLLINFPVDKDIQITKIFILIGLIISFKAFYILYLLFFIPIIIFYYEKDNLFSVFQIIQNKFFIFFIFLILLLGVSNFFNTGCLLYPVNITCFENLKWSFDTQHITHMNNWYEQWSKAGAGPNFRVQDPLEYIAHFNWVPNWIEIYFFNKVSDFLGGSLILSLLVILVFYSKIKIPTGGYKISLVYLILLSLFMEWFYNHPSLRYGGYCLLATLIFLPISVLLEKNFNINDKKLKIKFYVLIVLSLLIFLGRNLSRIDSEYKQYGYEPIKKTFYYLDERHFVIQKEFDRLTSNFNSCKIEENECLKLKPEIIKSYGKYIFINN